MTYNFKALGVAATLALTPMAASAATVDITFKAFTSSQIGTATDDLNTFMGSTTIGGSEDFEGFTACPATPSCDSSPVGSTSPIQSTAVGDFSGIGLVHTNGGSQVAPKEHIVVRTGTPDPYGRYDVVGGTNWLDSNDLNGILWEIPGASGLSNILKIAFFLTDLDDVGSVDFVINARNNDVVTQNPSSGAFSTANKGLTLVTMLFSEPVNIVDIEMTTGTGDGFGIDGIQVGTVPLPAAGWLMIAGLGGLAALRRRKRAA